jgi:hypothetical protein
MSRTKLAIVVCLALSLFVLFAAPSLTSFTSESAYAMGIGPPPPRHPELDPDGDCGDGGGGRHSRAPEPATWLLIGSGAAGLVFLRKKLKK